MRVHGHGTCSMDAPKSQESLGASKDFAWGSADTLSVERRHGRTGQQRAKEHGKKPMPGLSSTQSTSACALGSHRGGRKYREEVVEVAIDMVTASRRSTNNVGTLLYVICYTVRPRARFAKEGLGPPSRPTRWPVPPPEGRGYLCSVPSGRWGGRALVGRLTLQPTLVGRSVRPVFPGSLPSIDRPGAGTPQALQKRKG